MADYQYGLNCIVAKVKGGQELDLKFVLNRKQYTVTYLESKDFDACRNFSELLLTSDALKASIWNVPCGPPGSKTRKWYVTDIWNPNIAGMEKSRLPEPTFSVVCKISHLLGDDFFLCKVGKHFTKDVIVLPRSLVNSSVRSKSPEIGDYLLVCSLIVWETLGVVKISRFVPLWAHWDPENRDLSSTANLNIVERGPEKSTLLIPDQIPCMWGVVQSVAKKSLKVYVPCIGSSVTVPKHTVYQHGSEILEEDWLQLWLTPQNSKKVGYHLSEVGDWTCSNCCWFGQAKKRYDAYLQQRLGDHYVKHSQPPAVGSVGPAAVIPALIAAPLKSSSSKAAAQPSTSTSAVEGKEVGKGVVSEVKEKSGLLLCQRAGCKTAHVFHMGLMTVYGVRMSTVKNVKLTDLVEKGSELRYQMNPANHHLRAVWIGPEYVTFKHLNFIPEMANWMVKRKLNKALVQELMKYVTDSYDAVSKVKSAPKQEEAGGVPGVTNGVKAGAIGGSAAPGKGTKGAAVPLRGSGDGQDNDGREEEEEGWSEDSEESEDELTPVLKPAGGLLTTSGADKDPKDGDKVTDDKVAASVDVGEMLGTRSGDEAAECDPSKVEREESRERMKKKKASVLVVVLMELTKFLMEKGKSETVAEACEMSAEFVARLEKGLEGISGSDLLTKPQVTTQSVGLQTNISSPVFPLQNRST